MRHARYSLKLRAGKEEGGKEKNRGQKGRGNGKWGIERGEEEQEEEEGGGKISRPCQSRGQSN